MSLHIGHNMRYMYVAVTCSMVTDRQTVRHLQMHKTTTTCITFTLDIQTRYITVSMVTDGQTDTYRCTKQLL